MAKRVQVPAPNRLDRVIESVSPKWGLRRRQARLGLAMTASWGQGGYVGASRKRTATQEWKAAGLSPNDALLPDLPVLRERSQDAVRNNAIARGAVEGVVKSVVGTGLQARPRIDRATLGLSEAEATAWQTAALREWSAFAYSQECDFGRTLTFDGIQQVAFRSVLADGDHFVAKRFLERPGSPFGLKLQLIAGARVCNPDRKADSATLRAGIEFDAESGAPQNYHIANRDPCERLPGADALTWAKVPAFGEKSGMRQVLHLFRPREAGVLRGEPYLAAVLELLRQCGTWTDAEMMAAVVNSCFAITSKTADGAGLDLPESGESDSKGDPIVLSKPGTMVDLAQGETLEAFTPERPSSSFDPFMMSMLRQIGMALQVPVEVLIMHFQSSYSAARGALLEAWRFYRGLRDWHAWALCQPSYEAVLVEAVARGRLAAPGFLADPMVRVAWCGCEWYGEAPGSLDPLKEVEAYGKAVAYRLTTRQRATIELNGGDYDANHQQLVREQQDAVEGGLLPEPTSPGPDPAAPTNEPNNNSNGGGQ
jgi:lambda family phage portal protein